MQGITFALPTLTTDQMKRQDQIDITVNQATAAIICCYLEHMSAAINKGIPGATTTDGVTGTGFIEQVELLNLINNVQAALSSVP